MVAVYDEKSETGMLISLIFLYCFDWQDHNIEYISFAKDSWSQFATFYGVKGHIIEIRLTQMELFCRNEQSCCFPWKSPKN